MSTFEHFTTDIISSSSSFYAALLYCRKKNGKNKNVFRYCMDEQTTTRQIDGVQCTVGEITILNNHRQTNRERLECAREESKTNESEEK